MKIKHFITLIALLAAHSVSAVPLLEKDTISGFISPAYAINKTCVIHRAGTMVNSYNLGGLASQRSTVLKLSLAKIVTMINNAALGSLTPGQPIPDAGIVEYYAYQPQADGSLKKIVLWQGGAPQLNNSAEALTLRNFIDLNCGDPLL
jgi:hypothetical protein